MPQAIRWLCNDKVLLNEQGHALLRHRKQCGYALVSPGLE